MVRDQRQWCYLEATEVGDSLAGGLFASRELTGYMLERIDRVDARLGSYATVCAGSALVAAAQSDERRRQGRTLGPLDGVPLALKDNVDTADAPTRVGMPMLGDRRPETDATVVRRLRGAGAVILGKLHLTEGVYAEYVNPFRPPVNPWAADRWAGASSSGNGVALAAGLTFGALGSDTGGSIRLPSACNGVTGVKPTWGRVSRNGVFELAATLDHVGPMARSVHDAAALLQVVAGADPLDPTASQLEVPDYVRLMDDVDLRGVVLGLDERWAFEGVESGVAERVGDAIEVLQDLGAVVRPVEFPDPQVVVDDWFGMCAVQAAVVHAEWFPDRRGEYGGALQDLLDLGRSLSGTDYQRLILRRNDFRGRVKAVFRDVDLLAIPAMAFTPPSIERMEQMDDEMISGVHRYTCTFTMTGNPTVTMPAGLARDGLPTAVQLVGRHFDEGTVLRAGHAFQRMTDWHRLRPPSFA